MSLRIRTISYRSLGKALAERSAALHPDWSEHLVTAVAVSFGVVIVATIALLMGMA